jgi:predicted ATP-binding protein involved in virulence
MIIKSIKLENYRCFEEFNIDFDENLTVIVAENGVGKSSVLDALSVALGLFVGGFDTGKDSGFTTDDVRLNVINRDNATKMVDMESVYPVTLLAKGKIEGLSSEWSRALNGEKSKTTVKDASALKKYAKKLQAEVRNNSVNIELPIISYYGTGRLWDISQTSSDNKNSFSRLFGYDKALEPASKNYREFAKWFENESKAEYDKLIEKIQTQATIKDFSIEESKALNNIREAVNTCLKVSEWNNIRYNIQFKKITANHPEQGTIPVSRLSDGVRSMLAMIADIAYRCTKLNPHLSNAPKETKGIVLIDEIEMHLHPRWQQRVIPNLQEAFPKIQFIITTHSPQVLTTVQPESIRGLVMDDNRIISIPVDFSYGAKSHELLMQIFGVNERPQHLHIVEKLNKYLELVDKNQYNSDEAKELRKELDIWGKGKEKALLEADMDIRLKEYQRKKYEKS